MKIVTWNVNGYRGIWKKGFEESIAKINPDILCIQETKLNQKGNDKDNGEYKTEVKIPELTGYNSFWNNSYKAGYAGTAIFVKDSLEEKEHILHCLGRMQSIVCSGICFLNIYAPAESGKLERLQERYTWYQELIKLVRKLKQSYPVCICGDFNIAKDMLDGNQNTFQKEDGEYLLDILNLGFVDAFRLVQNRKNISTWHRTCKDNGGDGVCLDYILISANLSTYVKTVSVLSSLSGSDHYPVMLEVEHGKRET